MIVYCSLDKDKEIPINDSGMRGQTSFHMLPVNITTSIFEDQQRICTHHTDSTSISALHKATPIK